MDTGPANSTVATGAQPVLTVTSVLNAAIAVTSSDSHASMFLQLLCVLTTFGLSCAGGWLFCKYYFSGGFRAGDGSARLLFCAVFGVCCNTIVLVLFELLDILTYDFRLVCLRTHILLLVVSILFAIPGLPSIAFFRTLLKPRAAIVVAALLQCALVYAFLKLAPQWPGVPDGGALSVKVAVLRTGVLGVCIMAVLSGFGVVDFPYTVMRAFIVPVNQFELNALTHQVGQIRDQVEAKQARLKMLRDLQARAALQKAGDDKSWLGGMLTALAPRNQEAVQVAALISEIDSLQIMGTTLAADLADLEVERARELASNTAKGAVLNLFGYVLAAYCLFKMFACLKSVLFGEDFTTDPVSRILAIAVRLGSGGNVQLNLKAASQWITLLFIGFVSFNSLRAFLKHMRRLYVAVSVLFGAEKETTSSSPAINSRLVLVLAGLLSVYTISSLMLLRAQLPVTHRNLVTLALGFLGHETNVEFDAIHRWFNGVQLISLLTSLLLCYWSFSSKKANAMEMPSYTAMGDYSIV